MTDHTLLVLIAVLVAISLLIQITSLVVRRTR